MVPENTIGIPASSVVGLVVGSLTAIILLDAVVLANVQVSALKDVTACAVIFALVTALLLIIVAMFAISVTPDKFIVCADVLLAK